MRGIADELLARNRKEKGVGEDKSIIGLLSWFFFRFVMMSVENDVHFSFCVFFLVKAEMTSSSLGMSQEEILAQVSFSFYFFLLTDVYSQMVSFEIITLGQSL